MMLHRHDLLRAEPPAWDAMLRRHPGLVNLPLVADWALREWPVIVRRRMTGDITDDVPAALPLPILYADSRAMMRDRVSALRHANIYEAQRYRHLVSGTLVERIGPVALHAEHAGDRGLAAIERAYAPALGGKQRNREPAEETTRTQYRYERRHPRRCLRGAGAPAGAGGSAIPSDSQRSSTRRRTSARRHER